MGFGGQSSAEKARSADIGSSATQLKGIANTAQDRSANAFKMFQKSGKTALDFFKNLTTGDRSALNEFLGPERSAISNSFGGSIRANKELSPRGAGGAGAQTDLSIAADTALGELPMKARNMAANALSSLSSTFGGLSQGFTSEALSGLGESAGLNFQLNKEQEEIRARKAALLGQLGQAIGAGVGGIATGGLSTGIGFGKNAAKSGGGNLLNLPHSSAAGGAIPGFDF